MPREIPSALIGQPAPADEAGAARRRRLAGHRFGAVQGQGDGAQRLGVMVRALPRGASVAAWPAAGRPLRPRRLNYKDPPDKAQKFLAGFGNPFSAIGVDPAGRSAHRLGRLRRSRDIRHRQGRQDRLQACRPADGRLGEGRIAAGDREGAGGQVSPTRRLFHRVVHSLRDLAYLASASAGITVGRQIDARQCRISSFSCRWRSSSSCWAWACR